MKAALIFVAMVLPAAGSAPALRAATVRPQSAVANRAVNFEADPGASPRIAALRAAVVSGDGAAVSGFWEETHRRGAPLIEPAPGDAHSSVVTFLWQGTADTEEVVLAGGVAGTDLSQQMERIAGTDVWYKSYQIRNDARFVYSFSVNDSPTEPDPLNPRRLEGRAPSSYLELPEAPQQPWLTPMPGVAAGRVDQQKFRSTILKNTRDTWVYTPPGFARAGKRYPLLIVFDGPAYIRNVPMPVILDNLIARRLIPPMVAISVGNVSATRRNEDLQCSAPFADFLAKEIAPWMRLHYRATADPASVAVGGSSYGGLEAAFAALRHPEVFGNVLSQSGSFWWGPRDDLYSQWLIAQFANTTRLNLRLFLDAGLMELSSDAAAPSVLASNRRLREVLAGKGYAVHYEEFNGGHEFLNWRGNFADGVIYLFGAGAAKR